MIINELTMNHFGKFHGKTIPFQPGINVVYGKNEAGKSTIHAFIRSMLFGIEKKGKGDLYSQYDPWDQKGGFEGSMRFSVQDVQYRLERSFLKTNRYVHLYDETHGIELQPAESELHRLLHGMTETVYNNTVSIGQLKSLTDEGLVTELRNHMANLGSAKNIDINLQGAKESLRKQKRRLEGMLQEGAGEALQKARGDELFLVQELEEMSAREQELVRQLEAAKQMEFAVYAKEKEQEKKLEQELLDNQSELNRLAKEQSRWKTELEGLQEQRMMKRVRGKHREPGAVSTLGIILLLIGALMCGAGGTALYYWGIRQNFALDFSQYYIYGGPLLLLGIILLIWGVARGYRQKKKRLFYRLLMDKRTRYEEAQSSLEALTAEQEALVAKRNLEPSEDYQTNRKKIELYEKELMRLSWEQDQKLGELFTAQSHTAICQEILEENKRVEEEIEANNLALETLQDTAERIRASFGQELNRYASAYVGIITGNKYTSLSIEDDFSIYLNTPEKRIPATQVSRGTIEQIYLCVRLAASRLFWPNTRLPLILDDTFAYYDDVRAKAALRLLKSLGCQVMLLTCHSREEEMLKEI